MAGLLPEVAAVIKHMDKYPDAIKSDGTTRRHLAALLRKEIAAGLECRVSFEAAGFDDLVQEIDDEMSAARVALTELEKIDGEIT